MTDPDRQTRLQRARYRAWRRGFSEADLAMGRLIDARGEGFSDAELEQFEALLGEADQDVYDWMLGLEPAPARYAGSLIAALREAASDQGGRR